MVGMSIPPMRIARSSAKACRNSGSMLGRLRRLLRVRFHRKGDKIPPCGQPLVMVRVITVLLSERVMDLLETMW